MDANTTKRINTEHDAAELEGFDDELDDEDEGMSEQELEDFLVQAIRIGADLDEVADYHGEPVQIATFEDRGLLTRNRGLVVTIGDQEFQLAIVRSR